MSTLNDVRVMIAAIKTHAKDAAYVRADVQMNVDADGRECVTYGASVSASWECANKQPALLAHACFKTSPELAIAEVVAELRSSLCKCTSCKVNVPTVSP